MCRYESKIFYIFKQDFSRHSLKMIKRLLLYEILRQNRNKKDGQTL